MIVSKAAATARGGGGSPRALRASVAWPALMAEGVPLVQVDGLDDLAPLAATAPPGVPDLPEGDIIALGDEVGVIKMIIIIIIIIFIIIGIMMMIIIIIIIVIVKGVAADRWHWRRWGGGHRTVAAALAEAPKAGAQFRSPHC